MKINYTFFSTVSNGVVHIIDRILLVVEQDAKEILETRRDLFKFRELFNFADPKLLERLTSDPDLTIFVPNNAALLLLPRDKAGRLRQDRIMLDRILNMHMIPRRLTSDEINNVTTVQTSIAQRLTFQVRPTSTNGDKGTDWKLNLKKNYHIWKKRSRFISIECWNTFNPNFLSLCQKSHL
jgi:uncharacterized surface protein with fasciclin (FAS1) repeats